MTLKGIGGKEATDRWKGSGRQGGRDDMLLLLCYMRAIPGANFEGVDTCKTL